MGNVDDGVDVVNATTATFAVTLTAASCNVVTPVAPTLTEAECVGGELQPPTLSWPTPTGSPTRPIPIRPYRLLPQVVTVTATLDDAGVGLGRPVAEGGWTETDPDDGDVHGDVRLRGVFAGGAGGADGDAGDVFQWCGHGADGRVGDHTGGGHLHR